MKLLLCGHGYLGREIARVFRRAGWDVCALSRTTAEHPTHGCGAPPSSVTDAPCGGLTEISCDLGEPSEVAALPRSTPRPDFIIHCASSSRGGPEAYRRVFLAGCRNLTSTFPRVPLLFTSSTSVYAQTDGSSVDEQSPADPDRETGRILLETERLVLDHHGIIVRLAGIYGPGRSVILEKFLAGRAIIEDDGQRFLNQIHRDDAARAIHHLVTRGDEFHSSIPISRGDEFHSSIPIPRGDNRSAAEMDAVNFHSSISNPIFNLTDSRPLTQLECYTALAEIFTRPLPPRGPRDPGRKRGWTHKQVSNAKLRATGWEPRFPCFLDAAPIIAPTIG